MICEIPNLFIKSMKRLYLALQKLHCLIGMLAIDKANLSRVISKGHCDLKYFSRTRLSGKRLQGPTLAKARSELVPVFQWPELKLAASLVLYKKARQLYKRARHALTVRTIVIVTPINVVTVKMAGI